MIRSRQSRVHPRASTRYTLAKSVFSPRKPRGTISIESIRVHEGEAATAGGHECVSTLSCPPDNGEWVTPYQGIRKERLVSCNAIFFDPRGRAIYIYIDSFYTRETHVAWKTMAKILRYTSIRVNILDVVCNLWKKNDRRGRFEDTFIFTCEGCLKKKIENERLSFHF